MQAMGSWWVQSSASKVVWTAGVTPGLRVPQGTWGKASLVKCFRFPGQKCKLSPRGEAVQRPGDSLEAFPRGHESLVPAGMWAGSAHPVAERCCADVKLKAFFSIHAKCTASPYSKIQDTSACPHLHHQGCLEPASSSPPNKADPAQGLEGNAPTPTNTSNASLLAGWEPQTGGLCDKRGDKGALTFPPAGLLGRQHSRWLIST